MTRVNTLFTLTLLLVSAFARADELADRLAAIPNPRALNGGWVADPANVIARRSGEINQLISGLEQQTSAEIAVVVLPTIGRLVPKDFAVALFKHWGIGKADADNGVLVLHILDQRRIEIETGYGMEGTLPDAKCRWITEEIAVPFFRASSFTDGHYEVVRALVRGIQQPDVTRDSLIGQLVTSPGATTETLPNIPEYDAIALAHAPLPMRIVRNTWTPLLLLAMGGLLYLLLTAAYRAKAKGKDPYAQYKLFKDGATRWQYAAAIPAAASALLWEATRTGTFFSPIPAALALAFFVRRQRNSTLSALREAPRTCKCGKPMTRLDEKQDDRYIEKGQIAEESIRSVDYDVWLCNCREFAIESYKGETPAEICTKCRYRTYRITSTHTLRAATTSSTGSREVTHTCANCNFKLVKKETIPQISTSSNSSSSGSSGGSGGSGGSFGGGSSGGGGSGSSY